MLADLSELLASPGGKLAVDFDLDASDLQLDGVVECLAPLHVSGEAANHAGHITVSLLISSRLLCRCDRCLRQFERPLEMRVDAYLAQELQDEDNEDYYLIEDNRADFGQIARDGLILGFEPRMLCREDCRGLCPRCGKDLNEGPCGCGDDPDPRMAVLSQLLERE